jgi:glycerol-3-phosphate dehydrogenase
MTPFLCDHPMRNYQVLIIGGGIIGSALAWELSKYQITAAVLEKGTDVAQGTSKANSGVLHSGINSPPGSLKAQFCLKGNHLFNQLAKELNIPIKWSGKYIIAQNDDEHNRLNNLKENGKKNNIPNLAIHDKTTVSLNEPNVICSAGLWVPTAGITLPYSATISMAENAVLNKIDFYLETQVTHIQKNNEKFTIQTNRNDFTTDILINAAGLNCHHIISMVETPDFRIYPCRGEYLVLDKNYASLITSMIYPLPIPELGVLGTHITPTIEGNILLGPSTEFINDPEDTQTTANTMKQIFTETQKIIPKLPKKAIINAFSGIRCKLAPPEQGGWKDYHIQESNQTPNMINLIGIESPGLTAAPAIAHHITTLIKQKINLEPKQHIKKPPNNPRFIEQPQHIQEELLKQDSRWGHIVCRCEHITECDIINALNNPLKAYTLTSIKYRCRAGMGRCQGGFCTQHIIKIIQQQQHQHITDIRLHTPHSYLFKRKNREDHS